ncbi:MAG: hypothetical protein ABJO09_00760 [Hyphomicrobiales bacterium]
MAHKLDVLSWLLGSQIGRWGAFALLGVTLASLALYAATRAEQRKAMAKIAAARVKSLQIALSANNDITNMSADERRKYVARWLSNSSK